MDLVIEILDSYIDPSFFLLLIIRGWFSSKDKLDKDVNQRDESIET